MPTIRDDSAGPYGTWNNDDLSWLDYLTAKASDGGNALANLGRNLAQGFSPIGTSEQGNMALQVPPIVSGIAQSYSNLAGSPSHPGNAYELTGVPELDAPIQQDMSNVLLSLYGGNAVSGLTKPKGALGAGAMREEAAAPIRAYHGTNSQTEGQLRPSPATYPQGPGLYAAIDDPGTGFLGADRASGYAKDTYGNYDGGNVLPLDVDAKIAPYELFREFQQSHVSNGMSSTDAKVAAQNDLLALGYGATNADGKLAIFQPNTVRSATTGETLFSDTGKPSILGSAMAGSSADLSSPAANAITQPPGINVWHGSPHDFDTFDMSKSVPGLRGQGVYFADNMGQPSFHRAKGKDGGYLYQSEVDPNAPMLDGYKRVSEQSDDVKNALWQIHDDLRASGQYRAAGQLGEALTTGQVGTFGGLLNRSANVADLTTGGDIVNALGGQKGASDALRSKGISGARLPWNDEASTYLMFDAPAIKHKWGPDGSQIYSSGAPIPQYQDEDLPPWLNF